MQFGENAGYLAITLFAIVGYLLEWLWPLKKKKLIK